VIPYFQKLNFSINVKNLSIDTIDKKHDDKYSSFQKYGVALLKKQKFISTTIDSHYADDDAKQKILSQLPSSIFEIETPDIGIVELFAKDGDGNGTSILAPPHVDPGRITCINIYENINGEETSFYEYERGGKINKVASFIAQNGDVYMLNVSKPHSVEMIPGKSRKFFTVTFRKTPFEKLASFFNG
jgi:hypothetical protein